MITNQKVSNSKKKDPEWIRKTMEWIIGKGYNSTRGQRRSYEAKKANYNLLNSIINESDFNYVVKPFGADLEAEIGQLPANFQNYNIIRPYFNLIVGEELDRPFNYKVYSEAGEGYNRYQEEYTTALQNAYMSILKESLGEKGDYQTPEEVEKYFKQSYTNNYEVAANKLLVFLEKDLRLQQKFNRGFQHGLTTAEEAYFVGIYNNEPVIEVCNPLNLEFNKNQDCEFIQDSDWVYWRRWLDRGQVFEFFADKLSQEHKDLLEKDDILNPTPSYQALPGIFTDYPNTVSGYNQANKIAVTTVAWKSFTKVSIINYPDRFGNKRKKVVFEENYKLSDEEIAAGYVAKDEWIPEAWIGHRIGNDIFIAEPSPYQFRSVDNPFRCKLPFVGGIYNNLNSMPTSLVDLIKPYQMLYNIIWFRLELEFSRASGKKLVMDMAQLPKSKGWTTEQWMYYFNTLNIAFINSHEEGDEGTSSQGKVSNFNQFTGIDMSLSSSIQGYFTMLSKIEQCVQTITGITAQRMGQMKPTETLGGIQASVSQSNAVTELYFYEHSVIKREVLVQLIEVAKIAYKGNEKGKLVFDDYTREIINTSSLSSTDFGVFVTNSVKDNNTVQALRQIAEKGISSGALDFSSLITLLQSTSVAEIKGDIREAERRKQDMQKQQSQTAQQQTESNERIAREKMDRDDTQRQLDREARLREAEIRALGTIGMNNPDVNQNMIPDVMEQTKLSLQQSQHEFDRVEKSHKMEIEKSKMALEKEMQARENAQQDRIHADNMKIKQKELELKAQDLSIKKQSLKYNKKPKSK